MSEQKTAKVTGVLECRKWDGPNGTLYFHKIELDNGEVGTIGKKKENAFNIGDSLTYTSEESQYGLKFKAAQQGNGFGGGKSSGSPASFALSYAKDVMVAAMPLHPEVKVSDWVDVTLAAANKFHNFLKEHE